jgi:SpoVK/Ycf46/Vps4 family AAA+-type ATPase
MARADLLINLVRAGSLGDQVGFRRTLEAMVAEERGRQHHAVAERLAEYLSPKANGSNEGRAPAEAIASFCTVVEPQRTIADMVLPDAVADAVREVAEEQHRADLLRSHALEPRHRLLFAGPPGNGKTALAEALAAELMVPLLVARYDGIVGSYLGETAVRLARLFDQVRTQHCVLFFDEFDAIGKERGDEHETGEIKRVVSSLLMQVDALPSYVVVVTATNHPELLDRAVWRRFQVRLTLPLPKPAQVAEWFHRFEERTGTSLGTSAKLLSERLKGVSFAELEEFCLDVLRRAVLAQASADVKAIVASRLAQWELRLQTKG